MKRLGRALLEAAAGHLTALDQTRAQAEAEEDLWGSGIIQLLSGIVAREADVLEDAATVFGQLDAPVLQSWANCLAAADGRRKKTAPGAAGPHHLQGPGCARSAACGPAMG